MIGTGFAFRFNMKLRFLLFIPLLSAYCGWSQDALIGDVQKPPIQLSKPKKYFPAIIVDGDTMAYRMLPTVLIVNDRVFKSASEERKYKKLIRDVKKAYPYARLAGDRIKQYEAMVAGKSEAEKKRMMKDVEKQLKAEFSDDLENLTMTQGRILLKLIDRETGNTSYQLIKDFRGSISAFFWQSFGRFFDVNLKTNYDPEGEDKQIENIVLLIQRGQI
jgi:hypothetical protein